MMLLRVLLSMICSLLFAQVATAEDTPAAREALIQQLLQKSDLQASYIRSMVNKAHYQKDVLRRIQSPYEAKPYHEYRKLFVNSRRVQSALTYLNKHRQVFDRCEQRYGVQREIIAAILAMETRFGAYMGRDKVLDALVTLSLGYPRRAKFFRGELLALLELGRDEGLDVSTLVGSYAGAFGVTQFIPTSYRAYAVDGDGDGRRDVWHSPEDIVCSVANYFHRHHWDAEKPVLLWLPDQQQYRQLKVKRLKKWRRFSSVRSLFSATADWHDDDRVNIIAGGAGAGRELALVHYNFYVITRWNRAFHYAMAASELAAAISQEE